MPISSNIIKNIRFSYIRFLQVFNLLEKLCFHFLQSKTLSILHMKHVKLTLFTFYNTVSEHFPCFHVTLKLNTFRDLNLKSKHMEITIFHFSGVETWKVFSFRVSNAIHIVNQKSRISQQNRSQILKILWDETMGVPIHENIRVGKSLATVPL